MPSQSAPSASAVGDGGFNWLQRAYNRAVQQAKDEGRPLEEVAAERWGSLEKLERLLEAAKRKQSNERGRGRNDDDRSSYDRSRPWRRDFDSRGRRPEETSARYQFYKPAENDQDGADAPPSARSSAYGRGSSFSKSGAPSWKKKEFIKREEEFKETVSSSDSSSSDDEVPPETTQPPAVPQSGKVNRSAALEPSTRLTDDDLNALGAQILKAELMGDTDLAERLKNQIEAARQAREFGSKTAAADREEETVVVLTRTDQRGVTRPIDPNSAQPSRGGGGRKKKPKIETHNAAGARLRYFADDDKHSLQKLFEREKLSTAEDQDAMFVHLAGKAAGSQGPDFDMDEVILSRATRKDLDAEAEEHYRQQAIREHQQATAAMNSCCFCFGSARLPKHLIIAIASKVYLALPQYRSLTEGHCLIVPMRHVQASTYLDEDVWEEVQEFRKALTRLFGTLGQDTVFFETSMHFKRCPHFVLQCVPVPRDAGDTMPLYFKKAILESETEWSHNKKLVDLSQKNVRKAVPKGLPYFAVDFGMDGGFAHVIEDEKMFPRNFAEEIIGGVLDLSPQLWRKPPREKFNEQRQKVLKFAELWKPYDWTVQGKDSAV